LITTPQKINVYRKPEQKYQLSCSNKVVDVLLDVEKFFLIESLTNYKDYSVSRLDKYHEMVGKRAGKSVPLTKTWAPAYPPYREMLYIL